MSFIEIFAPDLLAALAARSDDAAAGSIHKLLARADRHTAAWRGEDVEIAALVGIVDASQETPALAAITAARDLGRDDLSPHLCRADPVHLRADPSRLILFDAESIELEAREADDLIAHLNEAFAGQGLKLERGRSPLRWYAEIDGLTVTRTPSPRDLRGHPVESCLDTMRTSGVAGRVLTELQMVLFEAPVNSARVAAGLPPVNSLWLWGLGPGPDTSRPRVAALLADDDTALACAEACGIPARPLDGSIDHVLRAGAGLAVVCRPFTDADALAAFTRDVWQPALRLLGARRVTRLRVRTRTTAFELGPFDRWKFWRRPAGVPLPTGPDAVAT